MQALVTVTKRTLSGGAKVNGEFDREDGLEMTNELSTELRILVVDDEPIICDSLRMLLGYEGYAVQTASDGKAALEVFSPDQFDLLITDYAMPGMTGDQLADEIKKQAPDTPVIMVTAYAEMLGSWGVDLSNVDSVISKPFRLVDLRKALREV